MKFDKQHISVALALGTAAIMLLATQTAWLVFWILAGAVGFAAGILRYERRIGPAGFWGLLVAAEAGRSIGGIYAPSMLTPLMKYLLLGGDMLIGSAIFAILFILGNRWAFRHPIFR